MTIYDVLVRPLVTEKGVNMKENERTLCFEIHAEANKTQVKAAVEKLFKVKVQEVRTARLKASYAVADVSRAIVPIGRRLT